MQEGYDGSNALMIRKDVTKVQATRRQMVKQHLFPVVQFFSKEDVVNHATNVIA
jgi:hypothetical protein